MNLAKKLFLNVAIGSSLLAVSPAISEDLSKGLYITGGIGASRINDIDIEGTTQEISFDNGLGFDIGFGYDFGKTRIEGNWNRGKSDGGVFAGVAFTDDTKIDSLSLSGYYDFRADKLWSPFVGISIASSKVAINNFEDTAFSYGLALGLSYKTSENSEVFVKSQGLVTPELDFGTFTVDNATFGTGTVGVRYKF